MVIARDFFFELVKRVSILFFVFLPLLSKAGEKPIAYNSLVFPGDIKDYPLLFVSEINGEENLYNFTLEKFILKQEQKRNIKHKLISQDSLVNYPVEKYKYVVFPTEVNVTTFSSYSTNYSQVITYFFHDRIRKVDYRIFAETNPMGKNSINQTYPMTDLNPAPTADFPKELERILAGQENHSAERQNAIEFRKQQSGRRLFYVLLGLITIATPVIGVIVG